MGLFGKKDGERAPKKNEGGLMDSIRCDETDYLIWKWRPKGQESNSTNKENAIRYGSSLSVKDGEFAVFLYNKKDESQVDFIEGPHNDTIKTANFPVLANMVGLAFGGGTPFQAEIYFINMAGLVQVQFAVPYFDVFDPRLPDFPISMAVRGSFVFGIADCKKFIKLHRLANFDLDQFKTQIKDALTKYVKAVAANIPDGSYGGSPIPVVQMERRILQVNDIVQQYVEPKFSNTYGVELKSFDITDLDVDKTCEGYKKVKELTADYTEQSLKAQQRINVGNLEETNRLQMEAMKENQKIQMQNMEETLRINREEGQYAQRKQTDINMYAQQQQVDVNAYAQKLGAQTSNIGAFGMTKQVELGKASADAMGKMGAAGNVNLGSVGAAGFNPGAMMANMAMGQVVGNGMANMMGNAFGQMGNIAGQNVPPVPGVGGMMYNVAENGVSTGPYSVAQLRQMAASGKFTKDSLVWTQGMAEWAAASKVAELSVIFAGSIPPVPPPLG